jgi:hypothetical protein
MANKILWEKWRDPIEASAAAHEAEKEEWDETSARESFLRDGDSLPGHKIGKGVADGTGPCLVGPMGIIPVNESNFPGRLFNFWMGHTNFAITHRVGAAIEAVPGVESFDLFSPYRFRMAVGKAFSQDDVKRSVEAAVCPREPALTAGGGNMGVLRGSMARKHPYWCICVMPDGRVEAAGGSSVEEVKSKVGSAMEAAKSVTVSW